MRAKGRPREGTGHAPVLGFHNGGIVHVEWCAVLFAQFQRINIALKPVFVVDEFQMKQTVFDINGKNTDIGTPFLKNVASFIRKPRIYVCR
jgi:hypothetical protein